MKFELEKATPDLLGVCFGLIEEGKKILASRGISQWTREYPDLPAIERDLLAGHGYLLRARGEWAAYFCLSGPEDAYEAIQGAWNWRGPYAVLHRLAIARNFQGCGAGAAALEKAESVCIVQGLRSLRTDTVEGNFAMRRLLERHGFILAGVIHAFGLDLIAYEKPLGIV